jgi:hypothetical protein
MLSISGVLNTNVMRLVVLIFGLFLQGTLLSSLFLVIPEAVLVLGNPASSEEKTKEKGGHVALA